MDAGALTGYQNGIVRQETRRVLTKVLDSVTCAPGGPCFEGLQCYCMTCIKAYRVLSFPGARIANLILARKRGLEHVGVGGRCKNPSQAWTDSNQRRGQGNVHLVQARSPTPRQLVLET